MSLRWSSYVASQPLPQKRGAKTQNSNFSSKIALRLKKVLAIQSFFVCKNFSDKVVRHSLALRPLLPKILGQTDRFGAKSPIYLFFARSASAVTPSEKSSIITNRKSTTRFRMSPRRIPYVALSPQRVAQKRTVSKLWTINYDNSETVRDRLSVTINH